MTHPSALADDVPVWFLDVDGVLNATPAPARRHRPEFVHTTLRVHDGGELREVPVWWRPSVVAFINDLARTGRAQMRWLTTWGQQAATLFAPAVGLDPFPVAGEQPTSAGADPTDALWWKVATIRTQVPTTHRVVFADDDLTTRSRQQLRDTFDDVLLVTTMPSPGLTDQHLATITRFLQR
ncbi:HAD domain-containing protein [Promicromonospora sp. NFX87]|uniref:HAD domain-containing protein n=1 Tax=Promicromonospora sp. NFX87 TaxID=3402691 RepID=UPI003AFB3800